MPKPERKTWRAEAISAPENVSFSDRAHYQSLVRPGRDLPSGLAYRTCKNYRHRVKKTRCKAPRFLLAAPLPAPRSAAAACRRQAPPRARLPRESGARGRYAPDLRRLHRTPSRRHPPRSARRVSWRWSVVQSPKIWRVSALRTRRSRKSSTRRHLPATNGRCTSRCR